MMNTGTLLPLGASLIPGWNALSTDEQMVVLLKALVGVATNKGEFFEIIRASGYPRAQWEVLVSADFEHHPGQPAEESFAG